MGYRLNPFVDPSQLIPIPKRTHGEMALAVLDWLEKHRHFGKSDANRIARMCRQVDKLEAPIFQGQKGWDLVAVSMQDLLEMHFISQVFGDLRALPILHERFRKSLLDDPIPSTNKSTQTHGRDTQLELFMGAIAFRGGVNLSRTVTEDGPDWQCDAMGIGHFAIEVKRLKTDNEDGVRSKIFEAVDQIERVECPGVVLIDNTWPANPEMKPWPASLSDEELQMAAQKSGRNAHRFLCRRVFPKMRNSRVAAVIVHESITRKGSADGRQPHGLIGNWQYMENPYAKRKALNRMARLWEFRLRHALPDRSELPR